jgi:hypothetical protein
MLRKSCLLAFVISSAFLATGAHADSIRCGTKLAQIGHTKADVTEICGTPKFTDSFCEPYATNTQIHAQQQGNNNVQNNIAIQAQACRDIDIWTYHPGSGQLVAHLYFAEGKLRKIERGERIP